MTRFHPGVVEAEQNREVAEQVAALLLLSAPGHPLVALISEARCEDEVRVVDDVHTRLLGARRGVTRCVGGSDEIPLVNQSVGQVLLVENAGLTLLPAVALFEPSLPTLLVLDIEAAAALTLRRVPARFVHLSHTYGRTPARLDEIEQRSGEVGLLFAALRVPIPRAWSGGMPVTDNVLSESTSLGTRRLGDGMLFDLKPDEGRQALAKLGDDGIVRALQEALRPEREASLGTIAVLARLLTAAGRESALGAAATEIGAACISRTRTVRADEATMAARALAEAGLHESAQAVIDVVAEGSSLGTVLAHAYVAAHSGRAREAYALLTTVKDTPAGQ